MGVSVSPFAFPLLLVLPACAARDHLVIPDAAAGPDEGGLLVSFSPTEGTFEAEEARALANPDGTQYRVLLDGDLLTGAPGSTSPFAVVEGGQAGVRYLESGPHHLTIGAPDNAPIFDGDGQVPGGGTARLFLYGPLDDLRGVFVSVPDAPAAGNEHVTVVNLIRGGQAIEVVSCEDSATCTPLSAELALGDVFDAEVPADLDGIGYRLVPSGALPDPPVLALTEGVWFGALADPPPAIVAAAPVYMSADGQAELSFN
jgi:hypothetical protein